MVNKKSTAFIVGEKAKRIIGKAIKSVFRLSVIRVVLKYFKKLIGGLKYAF